MHLSFLNSMVWHAQGFAMDVLLCEIGSNSHRAASPTPLARIPPIKHTRQLAPLRSQEYQPAKPTGAANAAPLTGFLRQLTVSDNSDKEA